MYECICTPITCVYIYIYILYNYIYIYIYIYMYMYIHIYIYIIIIIYIYIAPLLSFRRGGAGRGVACTLTRLRWPYT